MGGSGGDLLENIKREATNVYNNIGAELDRGAKQLGANSFEDAALQLYSGGLAGVNENGGIERGGLVKAGDEARRS